jgi:hypothetical protein
MHKRTDSLCALLKDLCLDKHVQEALGANQTSESEGHIRLHHFWWHCMPEPMDLCMPSSHTSDGLQFQEFSQRSARPFPMA